MSPACFDVSESKAARKRREGERVRDSERQRERAELHGDTQSKKTRLTHPCDCAMTPRANLFYIFTHVLLSQVA